MRLIKYYIVLCVTCGSPYGLRRNPSIESKQKLQEEIERNANKRDDCLLVLVAYSGMCTMSDAGSDVP